MNALLEPSMVNFQRVEQDGSISREWSSPELDMKPRVVCETCNNGWMSHIEREHAKPAMCDLILGNRVDEITPERAHSIALFAFKTAVIANHMLPKDEEFFTVAERSKFRVRGRIPRNVKMWLVGFDAMQTGGMRTTNIRFPNDANPRFTLNVCTFLVCKLGFQVVSAKTRFAATGNRIESLPTPPNLTLLFHPTLVPGVSWPPAKLLTRDAFADLSNRWNRVRVVT